MILAFDVAQSCGWAVFDASALTAYGVVKLRKQTPLKNLAALRGLFDAWAPTAVFVEGVAFSKFRDAHASYWRTRTLIEVVAAERGVYPATEVNTSALKKWATGYGNADKAAMCAAARERFKIVLHARTGDVKKGSKAEEDQADAILVGAWATS